MVQVSAFSWKQVKCKRDHMSPGCQWASSMFNTHPKSRNSRELLSLIKKEKKKRKEARQRSCNTLFFFFFLLLFSPHLELFRVVIWSLQWVYCCRCVRCLLTPLETATIPIKAASSSSSSFRSSALTMRKVHFWTQALKLLWLLR